MHFWHDREVRETFNILSTKKPSVSGRVEMVWNADLLFFWFGLFETNYSLTLFPFLALFEQVYPLETFKNCSVF